MGHDETHLRSGRDGSPTAPSEKASSARHGAAAQAGMDPREGACRPGLREDPRHRASIISIPSARPAAPISASAGEGARYHDDHGRHLHASLRLLQCEDGDCRGRSMPRSLENVARAVEKLGLAHVVITSVDRDDIEDGGAAFRYDRSVRVRPRPRSKS